MSAVMVGWALWGVSMAWVEDMADTVVRVETLEDMLAPAKVQAAQVVLAV